jgi:hypothetical protein
MSGLVAFLLFCTGILAHAQGIEWKSLNGEAQSLYRQGRYDCAIVVAEKAFQVAEQSVGPNQPSIGGGRKGGDKMENITNSSAFWTIGIVVGPVLIAGFFLIYTNCCQK